MPQLDLLIDEQENERTREALRRLENFINNTAQILRGEFVFREYTFTGAVTNLKLSHGLRFTPCDIITLSIKNADSATVTWNWDEFDATTIDVTTSAACTVRIFLGRYAEG